MFKKYRKLWVALLVFIILCPLGLIAQGTAFGEWGADELKQMVGFVPAGYAHFAGLWSHILLPDYGIEGVSSTGGVIMGYILSAVVGVILVIAIVSVFSKIVKD